MGLAALSLSQLTEERIRSGRAVSNHKTAFFRDIRTEPIPQEDTAAEAVNLA